MRIGLDLVTFIARVNIGSLLLQMQKQTESKGIFISHIYTEEAQKDLVAALAYQIEKE